MGVYDELHSGKIYYPSSEEIMREQLMCLDKLYDFNNTRPTELEKRAEISHFEVGSDYSLYHKRPRQRVLL